MLSRTMLVAVLLLGITSAAQAVTIDIASPQEGQNVYPGDVIELTVTVTNDTDINDCICVSLVVKAGDIYKAHGVIRLKKMLPGEVVSQTVVLVIPADLQVTEPVAMTITGTATGKKSLTEDTDVVECILAPEM